MNVCPNPQFILRALDAAANSFVSGNALYTKPLGRPDSVLKMRQKEQWDTVVQRVHGIILRTDPETDIYSVETFLFLDYHSDNVYAKLVKKRADWC